MNKITVTGRLTSDMQTGKTKNGKQFVRFTLADNMDRENVQYLTVQAWKDNAKFCIEQALGKGNLITVEGILKVEKNQVEVGTGKKKELKLYVNVQVTALSIQIRKSFVISSSNKEEEAS